MQTNEAGRTVGPVQPAVAALEERSNAHYSSGFKPLSEEMERMLCAPLPAEAIQPHPTKSYLSSIKNIYAIERLNQVFGVGGWKNPTEVIENADIVQRVKAGNGEKEIVKRSVVVRMHLVVTRFGIDIEQFGGHDNEDRGDAYKGAVTDAMSKICGYLGIGMDVYKGNAPTKDNPSRGRTAPRPPQQAKAAEPAPGSTAPTPIAAASRLAVTTREEFFGSNQAGRRKAFGEIACNLPADDFARILGAHGVKSLDDFKSANKAWGCYDQLMAAVKIHAARAADPTTYENYVAQSGAAA